MKFLWTTALACLSALLLTADAATTTCGPRVRRNWDSLSTADQDLYKGAIAKAMDSGAYIKFVEIHTEMMSEREAHRQCMFIYWHRLLLVTFENMLRAQGSEYACVTVPYWDWITGYNRQANSLCSGFSTCNAIPNGLGGVSATTLKTTLAINSIKTTGVCVGSYPLNHFCQATNVTGSACAKCITRGTWNTTKLPASTSYASVRNQLFNATNIGQMSPNIEQGCHNNIHANLAGAIATFTSPGDPLFWSHHSMVDLLHVIFHKCKVGTTKMTFAQKAAHPVAWTSCERRNDGGPFNASDVITMRTKKNSTTMINAINDPVIGKYFPNIRRRFADMMDTRDLGDSSYAYEVSGHLATMYNACGKIPSANSTATTTTMPHTTAKPATSSRRLSESYPSAYDESSTDEGTVETADYSASTEVAYDEGSTTASDSASSSSSGSLVDDAEVDESSAYGSESDSSSASSAGEIEHPVVIASEEETDESTVIMMEWYNEMVETLGGDSQTTRDQIERMGCTFQSECLGGVHDYSDEFKALWGAQAPRCKLIMDSLDAGAVDISVDGWRRPIGKRFGCPEPSDDSVVDAYVVDSSATSSPTQQTTKAPKTACPM